MGIIFKHLVLQPKQIKDGEQCGEKCTGMRAMPVGKLSKIQESYPKIYGQMSKPVKKPKALVSFIKFPLSFLKFHLFSLSPLNCLILPSISLSFLTFPYLPLIFLNYSCFSSNIISFLSYPSLFSSLIILPFHKFPQPSLI